MVVSNGVEMAPVNYTWQPNQIGACSKCSCVSLISYGYWLVRKDKQASVVDRGFIDFHVCHKNY